MDSKVSGLLSETLAPEIQKHVFGARLESDFRNVFVAMTDVNQAHVLMLAERAILAPDTAQALARVLVDLEDRGADAFTLDPAREDTYFNYEAKVIEEAGAEVGGRMHIGRSRNDLKATIDRMRSRRACLDILDSLATVRETALNRAETHADVVMPGYTHLQPAQPITFGYFVLGFAQAFERDHQRITDAYPRLNLNPLGGCAFAGTSFPIDRGRTGQLLGFDGLLEHDLDAVASRDFAIELLSDCALLGLTWSRLAQDFFVMVSHEFRTVTFPDRVFSTSSIMPQKKNPVVLEHLKGKSAQLIGSLTTAMAAIKGTNFTNVVDGSYEALRWYFDSLDDTISGLSIVDLVLGTAEPNTERMLELVEENYSTATDLTDNLVRQSDLSFREAHHVVGRVVRVALEQGLKANEITSAMVEEASREVAGRAVTLDPDTVRRSLDAAAAVEGRKGIGGPAPDEVRRMIGEARKRLADDRRRNDERRARVEEARQTLKAEITALAGG